MLALEISPGVTKSAVWTVINSQTQVVAVSSPANWQPQKIDSLITAIDATISEASSRVDENGKIAINKVILGLSTSWIKDEKIDPEKMAWIRQICEKLKLTPVGFVVTFEAVIRFVQHKEGVPLTAITLGFWANDLEISLVRLGKIESSVTVSRSQNLTDDVVEGLSRFPSVDMLPSRMLLYDSGIDLEEVKQLLLSYPWLSPTRKFGFLHFPKVEILPADFTIRAIALSGGTEVAVSLGMLDKPESPMNEVHRTETFVAADFGFTSEDVHNKPAVTEAEVVPVEVQVEKPKFTLPKFSLPHPNIHFSFPQISFNFKWGINLLILLFVFIGLFILVWTVPKAKVSLEFQAKLIEHSFVTELITQSVEASATETLSASTTGTKIVGDKATGSVSMSNALDIPKNFPAGTTIFSPSGLKFILDSDVLVASASGSAGNLVVGKSTAKVTASQVGTELNLSSGTIFRIGTFAVTQISAQNDQAFSGGSSREVKAVAKADVESLRNQILDKAKTNAKQQLMDKTTSQKLILDSITTQTISEDLNHKIGDSADNVSLKLTVQSKGVVVDNIDLTKIITTEITPLIPSGFLSQSIEISNLSIKKSKGSVSQISVSAVAKVAPRIDSLDVIKEISGKSLDSARKYLQSLPSIVKIDIKISPSLPIITSRLPYRRERIEILICVERCR